MSFTPDNNCCAGSLQQHYSGAPQHPPISPHSTSQHSLTFGIFGRSQIVTLRISNPKRWHFLSRKRKMPQNLFLIDNMIINNNVSFPGSWFSNTDFPLASMPHGRMTDHLRQLNQHRPKSKQTNKNSELVCRFLETRWQYQKSGGQPGGVIWGSWDADRARGLTEGAARLWAGGGADSELLGGRRGRECVLEESG